MRKRIESLVDDYLKEQTEKAFSVPVSGKIFDRDELINLIEASLEGWWTEGHWTEEFETKLANFIGVKYALSCNSGSSANLLAFSALRSPSLQERQLKSGDEVITVAAGFPTTINAILQNGCVPVFIDIELETYNIDVSLLEKSLTKKTKALMIAHTLGNPFNIKAVKEFCQKHSLWLIEDNCDALGSKYGGRYTGNFGDIATLSFYPAHQITTAEGGAVLTNDPALYKILRSLRDWGRHCWCPTGNDNTCNNRFNWQLGELPFGYDHKYVYGELGYNLKMSDLHAAIGLAQLNKLTSFISKRQENFAYLNAQLSDLNQYLLLPKKTENSEPCWFGFLVLLKKGNREELLKLLNEKKVGTRLLFGGNITKQPYFVENKELQYRIPFELKNTDKVMSDAFWVGVYPGLNEEMLKHTIKTIRSYFKGK